MEFCNRYDLDFEIIQKRVVERLSKRVSNTLEEKEQEKDQEKETEKDNGGPGEINPIPPVVEMKTTWLELKPDYPLVKNSTDDEQALFAIGDFIAQQLKIPWLPRTKEQRERLMARWRALANWILGDDFYRTWALKQLTNSLKTIWQKSNDGTNKKTSGTISNGKPVAGYVPPGGFGFSKGNSADGR